MDLVWIRKAIINGNFKLLRSKFLNYDSVLRQVVDGDPKIFHDLIIFAFDRRAERTSDRRQKYDYIISRFIRVAKDVHFGFIGGTTLLIHAVISKTCCQHICLLIKAGSDVNAIKDGFSVLMYALRYANELNIIKQLIKTGADVNYREPYDGLTPLFCFPNSVKPDPYIPMLLDAGANIVHCDDCGTSILMIIRCMCVSGCACTAKEAVDMFIKKGGDFKIKDHGGNSMFHYTSCKYLLDLTVGSGVSIDEKNDSGHTALMAEVVYFYFSISRFKYLLQLGADPNCTDFELNTILHLYAKGLTYYEVCKYQNEIVSLLLYHGGNWKARNIYNDTPLDILLRKSITHFREEDD